MGALDNRHTECLTGAWLGASHRHWLSAHVRIEPSCGQPPVKISPRRTVGYRPRTASHFAHGNGFHRASVFDENEPCVNHVRVSAYLLSIKLSAKVTHLTVCGSVAWVRFEHGFEFRQHELPPSFAALRQSSPCIRLTSRNTKGTPPSQPCSQRNDVCNVACKCSRRYYYNILNGYPSPPTRLQSNCLQSAFGGVSSSLRIPARVPAHLIPMCHWPPNRLGESSRHPRWREAS